MASQYISCLDEDDPVLRHYIDRIRSDIGAEADIASDFASRVIELLTGARFLEAKGPHVAATRWFDWMDGFEWWSRWWTLRHCILVFIGTFVMVAPDYSPTSRSCLGV